MDIVNNLFDFIEKYSQENPMKLRLKRFENLNFNLSFAIDQIESRQKIKSKLLLWQFREIGQINKNTVVVYNDYLQRQMILKILPRQNLPVLKDIMKIKHPNLMEIYDVMDDGINCNCLCEFVFGNNLDKIVYS